MKRPVTVSNGLLAVEMIGVPIGLFTYAVAAVGAAIEMPAILVIRLSILVLGILSLCMGLVQVFRVRICHRRNTFEEAIACYRELRRERRSGRHFGLRRSISIRAMVVTCVLFLFIGAALWARTGIFPFLILFPAVPFFVLWERLALCP